MEKFYLEFGIDGDQYAIKIDNEGIIVYGCDCSAKMTVEEARKVYQKLGEFLEMRKSND
ncbi:MAG: hypothetical protein HMLIMOIP_002669 [Candidatus Nitrosomirales archaeon]|jgi:hypothetical protein